MSKIGVVDFFSGCGGTSLGFKESGMSIKCAIDIDKDAIETFKRNIPEATCINIDIRDLDVEVVKLLIHDTEEVLFSACAPCQPFTKQNTDKKSSDSRINLLAEFSRFVTEIRPHHIFLENVPGLQSTHINKDGPLKDFLDLITKLGYNYELKVIRLSSYGVPQTRRRLVLLASRTKNIIFPKPTHGNKDNLIRYSTVRDWIEQLPHIKAGQKHHKDTEHQAAALSQLNLERIRNTPMGGSRLDWPEHLQLSCHKKYGGHTDVYGRMDWDKPANGLTTRCISYSNGRYGHPEQDRAISLREAGCIQTFPTSYTWFGSLQSKARQIGNAVPPLLSQKMGLAFIK